MKYLNIPANYNFLESLYRYTLDEFKSDKFLLSKLIVLLPSRRACNELKRIFLKNKTTTFLPTIKAIGDIDYDDIMLENIDLKTLKQFQEIAKPISDIKYKLLMIKKLQLELKSDNMEYLINISKEINSFLKEVEKENLNIEKLSEIVDDQYSIHWQRILKILLIFGSNWKEYLDDNKLIPASLYAYKILRINIELFKEKEPKYPILVAGNICSVSISNEFIKVLSKYDNTYLVFKGYENVLNKKEFMELNPYHSHYFYSQITKELGIKNVNNIKYNDLKIINNIEFIYYSMLPSYLTYKWQNKIECNHNNLSVVECKDNFEEIDAIIFSVLNYININGLENIAIITNVDLAKQLEEKLKYWNIPYNNTFGNKLIYTKLIQFLLSIIDTISNNFDPINLLDLLKYDRVLFGLDKETLNDYVYLFQKYVLFGKINKNGFNSYINIINKIENIDIKEKLIYFIKIIQKYFDISFNNKNLSEVIKNHLLLAEKICTNDYINGQDILWFTNNSIRIFEILQDFIRNSDNFIIRDVNDYSLIFRHIISELSYTTEYSKFPAVNLISYQETRLINYDFVIFTDLNDGKFPSNISIDPWMNREMRKCFGLPDKEINIGITNFEFIQLLSQKKVLLTRSLKDCNKPTIESRFLLRLKTFLKCNNSVLTIDNNIIKTIEEYYKQKQNIKIKCPEPTPSLELRPNRLSATNIEKLIKNPYQIYCKYILQLNKIEDINLQNKIIVFGNALHKIFEIYCKNYDLVTGDKLDYIINVGRNIFEEYYYDDNNTVLLIFDKFIEIAKHFIKYDEEIRKKQYKIFNEEFGNIKVNRIYITAKADRIENKNDNINIVDYKSSTSSYSKTKIQNGLNLQLLIEAFIVKNGGFKNIKYKNIDLVKYFSIKNQKDIEINNKNNELDQLIDKTDKFLKYLTKYFNDDKNSYIPTGKDKGQNDYLHLSRLEEWIYN